MGRGGELAGGGGRREGVVAVRGLGGGKGWRRSTISHDAALYLAPKWHLYLPKLSFDSMPHTEPQITFNTDIKSGNKECQWRRRRWRAALLSADSAAAARPASVTHTCQENYQGEEEEDEEELELCHVSDSYCDISHHHTTTINL